MALNTSFDMKARNVLTCLRSPKHNLIKILNFLLMCLHKWICILHINVSLSLNMKVISDNIVNWSNLIPASFMELLVD